jgi:hypothetical protein
MMPGSAAGSACIIGVSLVTQPDADAVSELEEVRAAVGKVF